jgi:hypothetical protein
MNHDRFVALGLARARAPWFTDVARWATSAALPLEFVKCLSGEEARARLHAGRAFSALLADGTLADLDRDLLDLAARQGCAVIVVDDPRVTRDWLALGASTVLPDDFDRDQLLAALHTYSRTISDATRPPVAAPNQPGTWRGSLVAVTGAGGSGTSTVSMALAQGLSDDTRHRGAVLLADLALDADQGLLHDVGEVVPGLPELVDAHRNGTPSLDALTRSTFVVPDRHYRLLLGLRRHRDWATLRPRALDATIANLQRTHRVVVADIDPDVEGERECGSIEVEERNLIARTVVARADLVVVVARPGFSGIHRLVRILSEMLEHGVPPERLLPLVNRAPRSPRAHAETTAALAALLRRARPDTAMLPNAIYLPDRRRLDQLQHDGTRLPAEVSRPLATAVAASLERVGLRELQAAEPEPITPGSLGVWTDQELA